jgi:hypothetical protein
VQRLLEVELVDRPDQRGPHRRDIDFTRGIDPARNHH